MGRLSIQFTTKPESRYTPGRRQSKTLLTIDGRGSKIARNSIFDCHLSPVGRQMAIKNSISNDFLSTFIDSIDVFDCRLLAVRYKAWAVPEEGAGGLDPPLLKNHKIIGFPSNTGLDPLKNKKKATKSAFNAGHHRHASETTFEP